MVERGKKKKKEQMKLLSKSAIRDESNFGHRQFF